MKKIPFYTILQEAIMQLMMIVMIIAYICYDYRAEIGYLAYVVIAISIFIIILVMRKQITSMTVVHYLTKIPVTKKDTISRNWLYPIFSNVFILGLTGLHFWLYYINNQELMPLYTEYGFGAVLAIAMLSFNYFKWECHLTNKGIAVGSKLESKLIPWLEIKSYEIENEQIKLNFKKTFPILRMHIKRSRATIDLEKLLIIEVKQYAD